MVYDYIVVGGGSSGCLVAGRLATRGGARVLLLESGPRDNNPMIRMPAGFVKLLDAENYMWIYPSIAQAQLAGRAPLIPQARVLGGGSSVNAMIYIRGQAQDYQRWQEATGDVGWSYDRLLPYFVEMEGNDRLDGPVHGRTGPWKVSDPRHVCELSRAFVEAAQQIGLRHNPDFNSGDQAGAGLFQTNTYEGRRCSAVNAFLRPAMASGRLEVLTDCDVTRVVFEGGRATGVECRRNGQTEILRTGREVILAAGALSTPKILMLSGIGPADHLRTHGIDVRAALAGVGESLQDHPEVPVLAFCNGAYGYFGQDRGLHQIRNGLEYLLFKKGPVMSNGVEAGTFLDPDDLGAAPKLQQFCVPSVYLDKDHTDLTPSYGVTINSCVLRPKSRGTVRLNSPDPSGMPLIDPNYLSDPEDLDLAVKGLRRARQILNSAPLAGMVEREIFPGPDVTDDAGLGDHAKRFVKTVYHPVGTCAMGRDGDPAAVLTPDLRVRDVDGLRVVDASAMPAIVSGNTNAAVLALAARAVDFILREANARAPDVHAPTRETA